MLLTCPMGPLGANCYLLAKGSEAAAIDPSDAARVLLLLRQNGLRVESLARIERMDSNGVTFYTEEK